MSILYTTILLEDWRIKEGIRQMIMDEAKTHQLFMAVDRTNNKVTLWDSNNDDVWEIRGTDVAQESMNIVTIEDLFKCD